jgi:hypothetical protein
MDTKTDGPDTATAPPRRRRLRLSLSLRAMMILVLVVGAGTGWFASRVRAQRLAVEALERMGGRADYDFEYSGLADIPGGQSRVPPRLLRQFGLDWFHHVTQVVLGEADDAKLNTVLDRFPRLDSLWISQSKISDRVLARVPAIAGLQALDIAFCPVTDEGIAHVAKIPMLRKLDLSYTKITDDAIGLLSRCQGLEEIRLTGTKLTRVGIAQLADFPSLRRLAVESIEPREVMAGTAKLPRLESLEMTFMPSLSERLPIGKEGSILLGLRALPGLKSLKIHGMVEDDFLPVICELTSLENLSLKMTVVTDGGLVHLRRLPRLKAIDLGYTHVTAKGVAELQKALPSLKIKR